VEIQSIFLDSPKTINQNFPEHFADRPKAPSLRTHNPKNTHKTKNFQLKNPHENQFIEKDFHVRTAISTKKKKQQAK
jgi:hypothetical protein